MLFNEEYCVKLDENEARLHMSFGEMDGPMQHAVNMKKYVNGKIIYEDAADGQLYYALEEKQWFRYGLTEEKDGIKGLRPFEKLPKKDQTAFAELLELDQPDLKVISFGDEEDEFIGVMTETRESPFFIKRETLEQLTEEQKSALTVHSTDRDLTCPFAIQIQKDPDAFVMY